MTVTPQAIEIAEKHTDFIVGRLSVAPMMDWTDRHCRAFHRAFTRRALLYTEMITTGAVLHGPRERLLAFGAAEHPIALQLGGSEPADLAEAARIGRDFGFDEINLNVGCPSDRVQSGCFGAALMREPDLVADCVAAMIAAAGPVPVSVKCRIGVDDQDPRAVLPAFLETLAAAGVRRFAIHARKAWLRASARSRTARSRRSTMRWWSKEQAFPRLDIAINGGITSLDAAEAFLAQGLDGVMIGRAAYHAPALLGAADRRIFGDATPDVTPEEAVRAMLPHIEAEMRGGARLHAITRHMLGAFQGRPGARAWRRVLSEGAHRRGAGPELVLRALSEIAEPVESL